MSDETNQPSMTAAEGEIRRRIAERGAVTFAEFMDVALYWPDGGYYSVGDPFGPSGDYYTSPMAHPAFGALMALQMFQMWLLLEGPTRFSVVELGAGNGVLGRDILSFSERLSPEFRGSLTYICVDRRIERPRACPERRPGSHRQVTRLGYGGGDPQNRRGEETAWERASRIAAAGTPFRGLTGCVLSNEFLDAFPVHVVEQSGGRMREVFVTVEGGKLVEALEEPSTADLAERLSSLGVALEEGQRVEVSLGLGEWAESVSGAMERGYVLTVDYGRMAEDLYSFRERPRGTLTTFYRHTQTDAPLRRVGRQDMSAQVDFSSAVRAGEAAGLETLGFTTQGRFLKSLGWERLRERLAGLGVGSLPARERRANLAGMEDLVLSGGLGDFRVLVQGEQVPAGELWGLAAEMPEELSRLLDGLPPPLLGEGHIRLAEGRWPRPEQEFELMELWPGEDAGPQS